VKTKFEITGGMLKWIAIIFMAIDHIGAAILENFVLNAWNASPSGNYFQGQWHQIYRLDQIIRYIGRPAFPIFCFLLVEGFLHTHDVKKYAIRLGIFALVSEIPFDLALWNNPFHLKHQNVFFTLLIGLLSIWLIQIQEERMKVKRQKNAESSLGQFLLCCIQEIFLIIMITIAGAALAEFLNTDYGDFGVLLIIILYFSRKWRIWQCVLGAIDSAWEITAPLAFVLIFFYNGKRGRQPRWFFYWFYPVHLMIYYLIGAWAIPAIIGV